MTTQDLQDQENVRDIPMATAQSALLSSSVLRWPGVSAAALVETFEQKLDGVASIFSLCVPSDVHGVDRIRDAILNDLIAAVLLLFPAWLPEARGISGPGGAGLSAVADLAKRAARSSGLLGLFLERMARAAVQQQHRIVHADLPRETVARECAKLARLAYCVPHIVLIVTVGPSPPESLTPTLEAALRWFSDQAGWNVWVAGGVAQQLTQIAIGPFPGKVNLLASPAPAAAELHVTPLAGLPNAQSTAEQRLEARLCTLEWAAGRAWNAAWSAGSMHNSIRVDLLWREERCVVELDGPDHLDPVKFAADRRRDRELQMAGYAVLRFTNAEVLEDIESVASNIRQFLEQRRTLAGRRG